MFHSAEGRRRLTAPFICASGTSNWAFPDIRLAPPNRPPLTHASEGDRLASGYPGGRERVIIDRFSLLSRSNKTGIQTRKKACRIAPKNGAPFRVIQLGPLQDRVAWSLLLCLAGRHRKSVLCRTWLIPAAKPRRLRLPVSDRLRWFGSS
jgi:hypothetical protein